MSRIGDQAWSWRWLGSERALAASAADALLVLMPVPTLPPPHANHACPLPLMTRHCSWVWQDGLLHGVPTRHSAILCFMAGPLGLLSHLLTKALWRAAGWGGGGRRGGEYVVYRF